jgi:hypothetical protein
MGWSAAMKQQPSIDDIRRAVAVYMDGPIALVNDLVRNERILLARIDELENELIDLHFEARKTSSTESTIAAVREAKARGRL